MSRGNSILISSEPNGKFFEGIVGASNTFYPGMCVQIDASVALQGGKFSCVAYNRDADGNNPAGPHIIVLEDVDQGKTMSDSYAAAERFRGYIPASGDELNLLLGDVSGTGDDHTAGELLIVDDGTGEFIATTGSPEVEPAMLLETITDPTADTIAWCIWC